MDCLMIMLTAKLMVNSCAVESARQTRTMARAVVCEVVLRGDKHLLLQSDCTEVFKKLKEVN